ncbi:MAG TPA: DUF2142 domain-containing protein [Thermomicrobiales bacterium]|jgi:4-amino-4-deoxy-L-arabinose transferase-like glycosyltransferase|nr:DUF2142 domain-containing protein [Thermomicrobiales bacterium]
MSLQQRLLGALILLYVAKALVFVFVFPPFSGHDEIAHYAYIQHVVEEQRVPQLTQDPNANDIPGRPQTGRGNQYVDLLPAELYEYCRYALQWFCDPNGLANGHPTTEPVWNVSYGVGPDGQPRLQADGVQYAANHPPLYYLTMAPAFWVADEFDASPVTKMYLLRLLAIPFGLIVVILAFMTTRLIFPRDPFLMITVPAFVALQTQISYEGTMVNNDIMSIAAYSWVLYLVIRSVRDGFTPRNSALIGFALGLGIITKSTSITGAAIIGLALLTVQSWRSRGEFFASLPKAFRMGMIVALPAVAMAAPWYVFMWQTYGNFTALPQVLELQRFWNAPEGPFFQLLTSFDFLKRRFSEFWGEFGWRVLPLDPTLMRIIAVPMALSVLGFIAYVAGWSRRKIGQRDEVANPDRRQMMMLTILLVSCAVGYLATVQFGTQFALTQARYFFPVINAFAILLMLGLRTLIPPRWHPAGAGLLIASLIVLNVFVVTSYVIPYYWA